MNNEFIQKIGLPARDPYANRCSVGKLLRSLEQAEREALTDALNRVKAHLDGTGFSGHTAKWLSTTLSEFGYSASERMIRRHCHGECSCES